MHFISTQLGKSVINGLNSTAILHINTKIVQNLDRKCMLNIINNTMVPARIATIYKKKVN